jgi:organic radical activating enzyme
MIAYACNVSCRGCISVSDIKRNGVAPVEDVKIWIQHWAKFLNPQVVTIFGGEPLLHPNVFEICTTIRNNWPTATIRMITNGYLLNNFSTETWFDFEPFEMQISVHRKDHEAHINQHIKSILTHRNNWQVKQHGARQQHKQLEWVSGQFRLYKSIFKDFVQPYQLINNQMSGYNSNPARAHAICGSPNTPILYKGALYKCPPVANLMDLTQSDFYGYQPVVDGLGLEQFVKHIGCPELVCSWCPDQAQATVIDHFDIKNVTVKHKITS